jgi:hypothetical protein
MGAAERLANNGPGAVRPRQHLSQVRKGVTLANEWPRVTKELQSLSVACTGVFGGKGMKCLRTMVGGILTQKETSVTSGRSKQIRSEAHAMQHLPKATWEVSWWLSQTADHQRG